MEEINITEKKVLGEKKSVIENYVGSLDELVEFFFKKVKPMEGVVKYKMINYINFPKTNDESKKIAKSWSNKFILNKKYDGLVVIIYFHIINSTIRFEVKKNLTKLIKFDNITDLNDCKNKIISNISPMDISIIFDISSLQGFPLFDECKQLAREWAVEIEKQEIFKNFSIIIFFNINNKTVKVNLKNKNL